MRLQPDAAEPIVLYLTNGMVIIGLVKYSTQIETLKSVIETRSWYDIDMPLLLKDDKFIPIGSHITVQRSNVCFYSLDIPEMIKQYYHELEKQRQSLKQLKNQIPDINKKEKQGKIIKFPRNLNNEEV